MTDTGVGTAAAGERRTWCWGRRGPEPVTPCSLIPVLATPHLSPSRTLHTCFRSPSQKITEEGRVGSTREPQKPALPASSNAGTRALGAGRGPAALDAEARGVRRAGRGGGVRHPHSSRTQGSEGGELLRANPTTPGPAAGHSGSVRPPPGLPPCPLSHHFFPRDKLVGACFTGFQEVGEGSLPPRHSTAPVHAAPKGPGRAS